MGHRMHVVRAVTQRAAAEYSWASWPERDRTKKIGVAFSSVFLETGVEAGLKVRRVATGRRPGAL